VDARSVPAVTGDDHPVVALVASAGGLDAVSRILRPIPDGWPASVVVLIHQEPARMSRLVQILGHRCSLPVVEARHGVELRPGCVSVVPPGKHLLIKPGPRTVLIASGEYPPNRPSADLLLATLATALGRRAFAVILSGGGHDGATGATAVHACGGTVLATDEASSISYSMPLAAIQRDAAVDHIVPLDEVADLLNQLIGTSRP
jgi:two-component system, chemotaxis family, protein-glutamate methylesterase/glutaminase